MPGEIVSDRVNELYEGKVFNPETQRACRDRIHWMCTQVIGNDVLDIGCSQGITALLLGREGHRVVGVDTDPAAIEYALREVEKEAEYVRRNVKFQLVGGEGLPFADESFDTVILGEILEHLTRPERLLAEAGRLLRPRGRVIITTPFGVHPHPGHVRTFYLSSFLGMVGQFFGVQSLRIVDGYITCVGVKSLPGQGEQPQDWSLEKMLLLSESAFLSKEQRHWEHRESLSRQVAALRQQAEKGRNEIEALRKSANESAGRVRELEQELARGRESMTAVVTAVRDLLQNGNGAADLTFLADRLNRTISRVASGQPAGLALQCVPDVLAELIRIYEGRLKQLGSERESDQAAIATLKQRHAAEVGQLRAGSERQTAELRAAHEAELKKVREELGRKHEQELAAQRTAYEAKIGALSQGHAAALAELKQRHEAEVGQLRAGSERQTAELRAAHEAELKQLREKLGRTHEQELAVQRAAYEDRIGRLSEEHSAAVARLTRQHAQDLQVVREQLAAHHEAKLKEVDQANREQVERLTQEHAAAMSRLREQHAIELSTAAAMDAQHTGRLAQLTDNNTKLRNRLDEVVGQRDRLRAECANLRQKLGRLAETCADLRRAVSREKSRATSLERKCGVCGARVENLMQTVRWRIGDAAVEACHSPVSILKLPTRLFRLYREGRRRERARLNSQGDSGGSPAPAVIPAKAEPVATRQVPVDESNNGVPPRREMRVACILDEFSLACFRPEARLFELTPNEWRAQIEAARPAFLFVESAWRGRNEAWRHLVTCTRRQGDGPLRSIIDYCRQHDIPTVFWNKEDPANFEHFIGTAAWFDVIFTTDSDCLDRYRQAAGHDRCYTLPFAAQQRIHHPVGRRGGELGTIAFAGTWYSQKHDGRREDAEFVLEPALDLGLHIYDRMHTYTGPGWQNYQWPESYRPAIRGGLDYEEMLEAYRKYHIFLNVNSVRKSPTMCARRVFEILACGTNVVSAYSPAIENLIGGDCVFLSRSREETRAHLERLLSDEALRNRTSVRAIRRIMASHTYVHRFARILQAIGHAEEVGEPVLACLMTVRNSAELAAGRAFLASQTYARLEPIWLVGDASLTEGCGTRAHAFRDEAEWLAAVDRALADSSAELVLRWMPTTPLGGEWIEDLVYAFRYFSGDGAGKPTDHPADALLFRRIDHLPLATTILRASALKKIGTAAIASDGVFGEACRRSKADLLATDTVGIRPVSPIDL